MEIDAKETECNFESQSSLMDADERIVAIVTVRFSPKDHYGSFRLAGSEDPKPILTKTTNLKTSDGQRFVILNLRQCPAFHLVDPVSPHLEFDYAPQR